MLSNLEEIKARAGPILALATEPRNSTKLSLRGEGNKEIKKITNDIIYIPKTLEMLTPILSVMPLQLFAYYCSMLAGRDVNKPRNLAKSVTVE